MEKEDGLATGNDSEAGEGRGGLGDPGDARVDVTAPYLVRVRLTAVLLTALAGVVLAITALLWTVGKGAYDVAATTDHYPITEWVVEALKERSVGRRATLPVDIPVDSAALDAGLRRFHRTCVGCHGAPGLDRRAVGQGLNPMPPRLERAAPGWTDAELFWITRNGLRLTGMPAFAGAFSDQEIAEIVAFLRQLEAMTEEDYTRRVQALP